MVCVPMTNTLPNGDKETTGVAKVGVRVELEKGEYFFYSIKHGSWTRHCPNAIVTNRTGTNTIREEKRVTKFRDDAELRKRLGHAKLSTGRFLTHLLVCLRNEVCPKLRFTK